MQYSTTKWKLFAVFLLAGLLASVLLLLVLAKFHEEIAEPSSMHLDLQIQGAVHGYTSVALTRVMLGLTWIGSPTVLFPLATLIAALLWWRRLHRDTVVFLIAMGGAALLNTALKLYFRRARPDVPWALAQENSFSYPSGHSVFAVVLYGILVYLALRYLHRTRERATVVVVVVALIFRYRPQPNLPRGALSQRCCSWLLCRLHLAADGSGVRLECAADGAATRQRLDGRECRPGCGLPYFRWNEAQSYLFQFIC